MHPLVTDLRERLRPFATPCEVTENSLHVPTSSLDGFDVDVTITGDEAVVTLGHGWHEHFQIPTEAEQFQQLFMLALTDAARLKVTSRGAFEHAWTLETRVEGEWGRAGTTGLIFVPFWKRKSQRYLTNRHVSVSELVPWIPPEFAATSVA